MKTPDTLRCRAYFIAKEFLFTFLVVKKQPAGLLAIRRRRICKDQQSGKFSFSA
jgi:hypothetical protein